MKALALLLIALGSAAHGQWTEPMGPTGVHGANLTHPENWIAILGDSGTTGAASDTRLEPRLSQLLDLFFTFLSDGELPPRAAPLTRVLYSKAEFENAGFKPLLNAGAKLSLRLDIPENSFGYDVARSLGILPSDTVLVGQDGVMVETIPAQFARIFEMRTSTLPPDVLVSFTANDLCDARVFQSSAQEWGARFRQKLQQAWIASGKFLIPNPKGTKIAVLAPFDVANVISNPELLRQAVDVEGQGRITCGDLRRGRTHFTPGAWLVLRMLNLMCPSVTSTRPEDVDKLQHLRQVQEAFSEAWKSQVAQLNREYEGKGLAWVYLEQTRNIPFATGDVGNDCFHPSAHGHAKIARVIENENVFN